MVKTKSNDKMKDFTTMTIHKAFKKELDRLKINKTESYEDLIKRYIELDTQQIKGAVEQ